MGWEKGKHLLRWVGILLSGTSVDTLVVNLSILGVRRRNQLDENVQIGKKYTKSTY